MLFVKTACLNLWDKDYLCLPDCFLFCLIIFISWDLNILSTPSVIVMKQIFLRQLLHRKSPAKHSRYSFIVQCDFISQYFTFHKVNVESWIQFFYSDDNHSREPLISSPKRSGSGSLKTGVVSASTVVTSPKLPPLLSLRCMSETLKKLFRGAESI